MGDWAIAIGNPFGLDRTFTVGVVSAIGRRDVDMMGGSHIQTDASINPGNSGGPLINIYGEVIGINRMIYSQSGGYMGIGFAIPINTARSILEQLKTHKKIKRGYIGVSIAQITEEYAQELGLKTNEGAFVGEVIQGSPAERGGVRVGDIILKINDKDINTYMDLLKIVGDAPGADPEADGVAPAENDKPLCEGGREARLTAARPLEAARSRDRLLRTRNNDPARG